MSTTVNKRGLSALSALVMGALVVALVAGCGGGSSSSSGSTAGGETSGGEAPKEMVKIGTLYSDSVGGGFTPSQLEIMEAYAAKWNAEGGINGHGVEIVGCNITLEDPTALPNCENKLVSQEKVTAFAGNIYDEGLGKLTNPAGIANITPALNSLEAAESPTFFSLNCNVLCSQNTFGQLVKKDHLGTIAYLYFIQPGIGTAVKEFQSIVAENGGELVPIPAPATTTNWAALATKAKEAGAEGMYLALAGSSQIAVIKAAKTVGYEPDIYGNPAACDTETSEAVPYATIICDYQTVPFSDPAYDELREAMAEYGPGEPEAYQFVAGSTLLSVNALRKALETVPAGTPVTTANFLSGTKTLKYEDPAAVPGNVTDFTKEEFPCKADSKWSGKYEYLFELTNGEAKLHIDEPIPACE